MSDANTLLHVQDDRLRKILTSRSSCEDDICYALVVTEKAVIADQTNEDVPQHIADARTSAFEDASHAWNEEGSADKTSSALYRCWSI